MPVMTIDERASEIEEEFAFLDDWEARYAHIIDLGKANPPLDAAERNEVTRVRGCASQVWMVIEDAENGALKVRAESDAMIVSGLIGLLVRLYSGTSPVEIAGFDANAFFDAIGVASALTAQRSNGLAAMVSRIQETAAKRIASAG